MSGWVRILLEDSRQDSRLLVLNQGDLLAESLYSHSRVPGSSGSPESL